MQSALHVCGAFIMLSLCGRSQEACCCSHGRAKKGWQPPYLLAISAMSSLRSVRLGRWTSSCCRSSISSASCKSSAFRLRAMGRTMKRRAQHARSAHCRCLVSWMNWVARRRVHMATGRWMLEVPLKARSDPGLLLSLTLPLLLRVTRTPGPLVLTHSGRKCGVSQG